MAHHDIMSIVGRELVAIGRLWRRVLSQQLHGFDIPDAQWSILDNLNRSGDNISQIALAHRLGLQRSALVRVLKDMEARGWIARDPGRSRNVTLTEAGHVMAQSVEKIARRFDEAVLEEVSEAELQDIYRLFGKMRVKLLEIDNDK